MFKSDKAQALLHTAVVAGGMLGMVLLMLAGTFR